jgi:hypothetical protein
MVRVDGPAEAGHYVRLFRRPERGEQLADALPAQHLSFPVDLKSGSIAIPS